MKRSVFCILFSMLLCVSLILFCSCSGYGDSTSDSGDAETTTSPVTTEPIPEPPEPIKQKHLMLEGLGCFLYTECNEDGNPVRKLCKTEGALTRNNSLYFEYAYDGNGKLTDITGLYNDCVMRFKVEYEGDLPLSASATKFKDSLPYTKIDIAFDENGKIISEHFEIIGTSSYTVEYDADGKVVRETRSGTYESSESVHTHGENEIQIVTTTVKNGESSPTETDITVKYNSDGYPTEITSAESSSTYKYNKNGSLTGITVNYQNGNSRQTNITYSKDNLIRATSYLFIRNSMEETLINEYEFDSDGNLIRESIHNEFTESPFILETESHYNKNGQTLTYRSKTDSQNPNAEYKSASETKYEYDPQCNLTKIITTTYDRSGKPVYTGEREFNFSD